MISFTQECPVCKNTIYLKGHIHGWYCGSERAELSVKIVIDEKLRLSDTKVLCGTECERTYRAAKQQANEAYDRIMEPFKN